MHTLSMWVSSEGFSAARHRDRAMWELAEPRWKCLAILGYGEEGRGQEI